MPDWGEKIKSTADPALAGTKKDEYGKPYPKTWADAVKAAGSENAAIHNYPELNPQYQADVATLGQQKGIEKFSRDVVDPSTIPKDEGTVSGLFDAANPQEGFNEYQQGLNDVNKHGPVGQAIGTVGRTLEDLAAGTANIVGQTATGHGLVNDPSAAIAGGAGGSGGGAGTTGAGKATTPAPPSAAESLMNSLVGQYQAGMATVDPYIGGSNAAGFASQAQSIGQGIAGSGVAAQDSATAGMLANDASAVQKANDAGAAGVQAALKGTGAADQAFLQVSPYLGVLQALTSEAQYKTETGTPPTSITGAKQPAWLQQAYQATIGASAPGATAVGATPATTPNPSTTSTTPSSSTTSTAGGGNA